MILNRSYNRKHTDCVNDTYTDKWILVEFNGAGEPRMVKNITIQGVEAPL